jgi:hypothetical protein
MRDADRSSEIQAPEAALALANLRELRASVGYPMTGDLCTLVDEIARLERVIARQAGEKDGLRGELERAKRPSYSDWHVWMVWQEERPIHALYATEDDARQGSIDCWEEDEPSCPDYSWKVHGDGRLELLVGGELAEVYITRMDVFGKAMAAERAAKAALATAGEEAAA